MSYCKIIGFKDGEPDESLECRNSWGGAAYIWDRLFSSYLKDPEREHHHWMQDTGKLWKLSDREDLPMFMRAVHVSTFDNFVVRREHFAQYAADLRAFVNHFGTGGGICHLHSWADFIEAHPDMEAIGFYHTSVSENPWYEYDDERDEATPYNLNTGTKHREVYDELAIMTLEPTP